MKSVEKHSGAYPWLPSPKEPQVMVVNLARNISYGGKFNCLLSGAPNGCITAQIISLNA